MMSRRFKIIFTAAVMLLNAALLNRFKIMGIVPNYTFAALLAITLVSPGTESVVISALSGLALDLLSGCMPGLNTILCMYLSMVCSLVTDALFAKRLKILVPMCLLSSAIYELLFGLFASLLRGAGFDTYCVFHKVLPAAVVNTIVFSVIYIVLSRLRFEKKIKGIRYEKQ